MSLTIPTSTARLTILPHTVKFLLRKPSISSNGKDTW